MRHSNRAGLLSLALLLALGCELGTVPTSSGPTEFTPPLPALVISAGFAEEFSSATLDPAWEVRTYAGPVPRAHGFGLPANDFSLTANPGHLRYTLNPMTHYDGYLNNYQTTFSFHSCCNHDAGLELHRAFGGEQWLLEARASYFMPFANGRLLDIRVYFGDGGANTIAVRFDRHRDGPFPFGTPESAPVRVILQKKLGPSLADFYAPGSVLEFEVVAPNPAGDQYYFRLERAGSVLTAMWSYDGAGWNTAFSRDMGIGLDGLDQRVVIAGLSWFVPAGSYADYDYVRLTPTVVPVSIDIKPGSNPNTIKLGSKGTIPVAILSTADFNAPAEVDRSSLTFGPTGDEASLAFCGTTLKDVNADGRLDLVCHFTTRLTGFQIGDTQGILKGETVGGTDLEGSDAVRIVS